MRRRLASLGSMLCLALHACVAPAPKPPSSTALLLSGSAGAPTEDVDSMERHLRRLEQARHELDPEAHSAVEIVRLPAGGARGLTVDGVLAELTRALLRLRDDPERGELLVYWSGPTVTRWEDGSAELFLQLDATVDGTPALVRLATIHDLLAIASQANVLVIVNAGFDARSEPALGEISIGGPTHSVWITRPCSDEPQEQRALSTAWWSRLFREELDALPSTEIGPAGPWRELRDSLDRALADNGQRPMPEHLPDPSGLWWMWSVEPPAASATSAETSSQSAAASAPHEPAAPGE